jgi:hypothetical protein
MQQQKKSVGDKKSVFLGIGSIDFLCPVFCLKTQKLFCSSRFGVFYNEYSVAYVSALAVGRSERETESERDRERDRETERQRDRERDRDRETERERERKKERKKEKAKEKEGEGERASQAPLFGEVLPSNDVIL